MNLEYDRAAPRIKVTTHWRIPERLKMIAEAEGVPVSQMTADLVRRGIEMHDEMESDRRTLTPAEFVSEWEPLPYPPGDSATIKVPLYADEVVTVEGLAEKEFEAVSSIVSRLLRYGLKHWRRGRQLPGDWYMRERPRRTNATS
jgi:hypothetical protein